MDGGDWSVYFSREDDLERPRAVLEHAAFLIDPDASLPLPFLRLEGKSCNWYFPGPDCERSALHLGFEINFQHIAELGIEDLDGPGAGGIELPGEEIPLLLAEG